MIFQAIIAAAMATSTPQAAPATGAASEPMDLQPIAMIDTQDDPAILLNLGVELARLGETEAARAAFEKVRGMRVDYTLETADGRFIYPPDLARQALSMLDDGTLVRSTTAIASR